MVSRSLGRGAQSISQSLKKSFCVQLRITTNSPLRVTNREQKLEPAVQSVHLPSEWCFSQSGALAGLSVIGVYVQTFAVGHRFSS